MKKKLFFILLFLIFFLNSCNTIKSTVNSEEIENEFDSKLIQNQTINDTTFVALTDFDADFILDMKYATNDNFLKTKVYDCATCYLRYKTVKNLVNANNEFKKMGFKIKLFDCYRPLDVQKKMWAIVPNATYVANPKSGSIHNRGGAIDITLVTDNGEELDMGTKFDFFGKEAAHNYINFSKQILENRILLKKVMENNNFKSLNSEWWHYNLIGSENFTLSNFEWNCD